MVHVGSGRCVLLLLLASCAGTDARSRPGPEAVIPHFAADDARVNTGGFVALTLRLHRDQGDVRYTLMAFATGDTLTLGAMVKGSFRGTVHWTVGQKQLQLPFDTAAPQKKVNVTVTGAPDPGLHAQGAPFRGTAWTNVEVPIAGWLEASTPLQLEFLPADGGSLVLPEPGVHYLARLERR